MLDLIKQASNDSDAAYLSYKSFRELTNVPMSQVLRFFDFWKDACFAAGVVPGQASPSNLTPNRSKGKMHALGEVRRVAKELGVSSLSRAQFDAHAPEVAAGTVQQLWGSWASVIEAAGLRQSENFREEISIEVLACEFLDTVAELSKVPTVSQMVRRSAHCKKTFTRKFGGYKAFKQEAIKFLLLRPELPDNLGRAHK